MTSYQLYNCNGFSYYIVDSKFMGLGLRWVKLNIVLSFRVICDVELVHDIENYYKDKIKIENHIREVIKNGTDC